MVKHAPCNLNWGVRAGRRRFGEHEADARATSVDTTASRAWWLHGGERINIVLPPGFDYADPMQTSLRKMGNSIGMIVPRSVLAEIGATTGMRIDLEVKEGRLIASPAVQSVRSGWAESAAALTKDDDAVEWRDITNEADTDWTW